MDKPVLNSNTVLGGHVLVRDEDGREYCTVSRYTRNIEEAKKIAARIATSCNSHDNLLEALEGLTDEVAKRCNIGSDPQMKVMLNLVQKSLEAIKKAKPNG